jgi:hypothetical protein
MSTNLPAARPDVTAPAAAPDGTDGHAAVPQRPVSVAFLPLGLVVFITLAFVIAAWTFLAAAV